MTYAYIYICIAMIIRMTIRRRRRRMIYNIILMIRIIYRYIMFNVVIYIYTVYRVYIIIIKHHHLGSQSLPIFAWLPNQPTPGDLRNVLQSTCVTLSPWKPWEKKGKSPESPSKMGLWSIKTSIKTPGNPLINIKSRQSMWE